MSVNVTNIKVSVNLEKQSLDSVEKRIKDSALAYKKYNNFIVLRHIFVYTIFRSGKNSFNHVNITKIKHFSEVKEAIDNLQNLDLNINRKSLKINRKFKILISDVLSSWLKFSLTLLSRDFLKLRVQ